MSEPTRRGRPPVADREELRESALAVVLSRGYETVTMAAIADELGIGLRTLHRYFPSKADIVWGGLEQSLDALRSGLQLAPPEGSLLDAVAFAMIEVFRHDADAFAVGRARLRLIATVPELQAARSETFEQWRRQLSQFVAGRAGLPIDALFPSVAGATLQTVIFQALQWWSLTDTEQRPEDTVASALRDLQAHLGTLSVATTEPSRGS